MFVCQLDSYAAFKVMQAARLVIDPDFPEYAVYILTDDDDGSKYMFAGLYLGEGGVITVPKKIEGYTVYGVLDYAFYGNSTVTNVTIPSGIEYVGEQAFANCSGLKRVYIPKSVNYIGDSLVDNSSNVTVYVKSGSYAYRYCKDNGIRYKTY